MGLGSHHRLIPTREVIGVQAREGKSGDENLDSRIFVPLPMVTAVLLAGANTRASVFAFATRPRSSPRWMRSSELLRLQHRLPDSYADDFSTEDQASLVKEAQRDANAANTEADQIARQVIKLAPIP
jgi:hypothetical protein